jgi:drug/metabolite transporter (DMT)-like permease
MQTATQTSSSPTLAQSLLLALGVFFSSTAVILIRASTEHPFLVASYRLLLSTLVLLPFFFREARQVPRAAVRQHLVWAALPALALALHFMSWIIGARMTRVTNASLVVNLTPIVMPFFLWLFYRERVTRWEVAGTVCTLAGLVVLSASTFRLSAAYFWGDLICLGSMVAMACYFALGRKNGGRVRLWLYLVPLYGIAGLVCLACALVVVNPLKAYTLDNLLFIVALALVPTIFGHSLLNHAMRHFRGQVVSVANLAQPLFAGMLGFLLFGEVPPLVFYPAAALILTGVGVVLWRGSARR